MFIVVEGIEGSGKSTLLSQLSRGLQSQGYDVVETREPGGSAVGDAIREIFLNRALSISPLTEALLVNAARAEHVAEVIAPALASDRVVLCDRFVDSTLAYQGYGRGLDVESLRAICAIAAQGLVPDLVLVLDLPVTAARARLRDRPAMDRIENEDDVFHERVRQGFLTLARSSPRYRLFDALLPAERVAEDALREMQRSLRVRVP